MKQTYIDTMPYWADSASLARYPKLDRDESVDVVIVGGGITGLTAAYLLSRAGRRVALLERDRCAQIDTGHTSAHLTMVTDARLSDLVTRVGRDHAQAVWDAGLAAIAQVDDIVRDEDVACDFARVPGYLHAPLGTATGQDPTTFQDDASLAADLGFDARFTDEVPFIGGPGIVFARQARIHPRKYLAAIARATTDRGGLIFEHSAAEAFSDSPRSVNANGHTIACDYVVLATHTPLMGNTGIARATLFQTKLALYTSYVVSGRVPRGELPDALFWDNGDPYRYLRIEPHRDHDVVIFGGEDHKTGQMADTDACFARLERTLTSIIRGVKLTNRWSGQVTETPDGLPYIGETADRQFAGTGYSGNGLTFGTLAGMMAADRVAGRTNPWSELFDPGRTNVVAGIWDYIRENKDYPYYLARDRFTGTPGRALRMIPRGSGAVSEVEGDKIAVYRNERGAAEKVSAVCTHLGCLVEWNQAERTWDCPCHGSRFKTDGQVISGPAESPLLPIDD